MYLIRLDDACEYRDILKWNKIEEILDKYDIKPIVAIIPKCEDKSLVENYKLDETFWNIVDRWVFKEWDIGLHGYNHVYTNFNAGGLNPINKFSEFSGIPQNIQNNKIEKGVFILRQHGIDPLIFVAPGHTFDHSTIIAIKKFSNIKIISDTIASDLFLNDGLYFIPQQCGKLRWLPAKLITSCYHPNRMTDKDFEDLERFLESRKGKQVSRLANIQLQSRHRSLYDYIFWFIYFFYRKLRSVILKKKFYG